MYRKQAVDELFFLNALKQFNPNYIFKNEINRNFAVLKQLP